MLVKNLSRKSRTAHNDCALVLIMAANCNKFGLSIIAEMANVWTRMKLSSACAPFPIRA